jgi:PAS domain S-box-containing protein
VSGAVPKAVAEIRARSAIYVALALALVAGSSLISRVDWRTSAAGHTQFETAATLLAVVVGVLALVRYYSRRERQFLFLGATFLGTGIFDGFHTFVAQSFAAQEWSWFASRTYLAILLFRLAIVPRPRALPADMRVSEPALYGISLLTTAAGILLLLLARLPAPPDALWPFNKPLDLIPGGLFLAAAAVNIARGGWRRNAFEHWLVLSQLTAAGGQLLFSVQSQAPYDAAFLVAHLLKGVGYACIYGGLLVSVHFTYRGLEESRRALSGANVALQKEVHDRTRAEEALHETAQRLEAIIKASPLAIMTTDGSSVVRTWNPAAERMLGFTAEQAIGLTVTDLASQQRTNGADSQHDSVLVGDAPSGSELEWTRPDGDLIVVSVSTAPLEADGGGGLLLVLADITERRRAEETMRQAKAAAEDANRAKSEFLASMSHELRTPLNSVIGFTKVLLKNKAGRLQPMELTYLDRIASNGEHLLGLINNILDLSKIEAGMLQLDFASTDLRELISQTLAQLEGKTAGGAVRLHSEFPAVMDPIETDAHRLRQVLINLIGNALKFTERGKIVVSVENEGTTPARILVSDTGVGIPSDRLSAIFEAFEQADQSTSRRFGGTGLGLSISRGICERLGYALTVESEVGRGSTFTIHLVGAPLREQESSV